MATSKSTRLEHCERLELISLKAPSLELAVSLTSTTYHRKAPDSEKPQLVVTATLNHTKTLVLELRGETDSGIVLKEGFRAEHFEFYDLTTDRPVVHSPFPGTCEPRDNLYAYGVVELSSSTPHITSCQLEDVDPLSDPVRLLEIGHQYRLKLKPQKIWAFAGTKAELFGGRSSIPVGELPEGVIVELASDDELVLTVEE